MSEELKDVNVDWEAEKLCRWGAARAGVIVVAPLVGTMTLLANEVYMITRLAELRGVKLEEATVLGLLGSLGATFVGQTLVTLIPVAPIQIPVAISVTYGVGKAANAWLKAGRPEDIAAFKEIFNESRKEGMENVEAFKTMDCKDEPLGDESKKFDLKDVDTKKLFDNFKDSVDKAEATITANLKDGSEKVSTIFKETVKDVDEKYINPLRNTSDRWISAQNWAQIAKGELVIPYGDIKTYLIKNMSGSDFALLDIYFKETNKFMLALQHKTYGTLNLTLSTAEFRITGEKSVASFKVEEFDITDNEFAMLVLQTVGDKLVLAIIDLIFDKVAIESGGVNSAYEKGLITADFTKAITDSKLGKTKFMDKSLIDVINLNSLVPTEEGMKIGAKVNL